MHFQKSIIKIIVYKHFKPFKVVFLYTGKDKLINLEMNTYFVSLYDSEKGLTLKKIKVCMSFKNIFLNSDNFKLKSSKLWELVIRLLSTSLVRKPA